MSKKTLTVGKTTKARKAKSIGGYPQPKPGSNVSTEVIGGISYNITRPREVTKTITNEVLAGTKTPEPPKATAPYKIDINQGKRDGTVSREWRNRPDDERFTSIESFMAFLKTRKEQSTELHAGIEDISFAGTGDDLFMMLHDKAYAPTDWMLEQFCNQIGMPRSFLQRLNAETITLCLQDVMSKRTRSDDEEAQVKLLTQGDTMRCLTSTSYNRIWDYDVAENILDVAMSRGSWKIPGEMNWSNMTHNPFVDITKDNTTLFASPRDMFMFLCQDDQPIVAGKLPNGDDDVYFRGFYGFNSETYGGKGGLKYFMLRGVCMNRNLWGVEQVNEISIKHTKHSTDKLKKETQIALLEFTKSEPLDFVNAIQNAQKIKVASNDDERREFLVKKAGLIDRNAPIVMEIVQNEEGHPMETLHDAIQGITALARRKPYQSERVKLEAQAQGLLARAA